MTKVSSLPSDIAPTLTDYMPTVDFETSTTKRITLQALKDLIAPQRLRRAVMQNGADGANGATITHNEANDITFTGTPTGYGRASIQVPMDYVAGTSIALKISLRSDNTNNQAVIYYIGSHANGAFTTWNVASNLTTAGTIGLVGTAQNVFTIATIPSGSLVAGNNITIAFRIAAAITGNIWVNSVYLEYTASV